MAYEVNMQNKLSLTILSKNPCEIKFKFKNNFMVTLTNYLGFAYNNYIHFVFIVYIYETLSDRSGKINWVLTLYQQARSIVFLI